MNRTPPNKVIQKLRKEVNYGCPVCGNPYLTWHHFDPPWSKRNHHNPRGMIALCQEHHSKADAGAYTVKQLHEYKRQRKKWQLQGTFDWRRQQLLAFIGSNIYNSNRSVLSVNNHDIIWYTCDSRDNLLLNINLRLLKPSIPFVLKDNTWLALPAVEDFLCPPNGRKIKARIDKETHINIEFVSIPDNNAFRKATNETFTLDSSANFPITLLKLGFKLSDKFSFDGHQTNAGNAILKGCIMQGGFKLNLKN